MLEHFYPFRQIPSLSVTASSFRVVSSEEQRKQMTSATDEVFNSDSSRCRLNSDGIHTNAQFGASGLSGELETEASADERVHRNKLLPTGEEHDRRQLSADPVATLDSSTMSRSALPETSSKQTDKNPEQHGVSTTPSEGGQSSGNVGDVTKGVTVDCPLPPAASQQPGTESSAANCNQPEARSKVKINLEATRGSVAVDELSSCSGKQDPIGPVGRATGIQQVEDLLRKTSSQRSLASEQDVEAEFLRFSLAFKCDMFTIDKRLRLEERSRDLAENNLKKEIEKCQLALQTVRPLCEEEQSLEIFEKLEKSLGILAQTITRVISRAEMLGAIHQETQVSKAVDVMIRYVENLKRTYANEHSELEEMKQLLLKNGNALNSLREHQDDHMKKRPPTSQICGRGSLRRISIAAIPKSSGGGVPFNVLRDIEDGRRKSEGDQDKLRNRFTRRISNWTFLGPKPNEASRSRPSLHKFISTCTWGEKGSQLLNKGPTSEQDVREDEEKKEAAEEPTLTEPGRDDLIAPSCTVNKGLWPQPAELWDSFSKSNKGLWLPMILFFSLSVLGSFLIGWSLHISVDAAAVGPGGSWKAIQQFLWPYTGLQHNGQPPV
ncbi:inositol 1,4,5-triphosphate receptor associated 2-like isoform X1 [Rhinoraja longicauda]